MDLLVIGINHKTAPVEVREKFAFSPKKALEVNRLLRESSFLAENLILSTCNRVEIYAVSNGDKDYVSNIKSFLGRFHNLDILSYEDKMYVYKNQKAVEHLFGVASGLDSMVIGEMEILGQVKKAYQDAQESRTTGKVLNRLFEKTFNTAKKIRSETLICRGAVSLSSAAVRLAEKILGGLKDKEILIIGAGQIGEQLVLYLNKNGAKSTMVTNRTIEKARDLANKFSALIVPFDRFRENLANVDIIIASTGAPHCILRYDDIASLMPKRRQRPLFIIDLAVPRDVQSEVNKIDNVYLYDIDDLEKIVSENMNLRKSELDNCAKIIDNAAGRFMSWMAAENLKYT